MKRYVVEETTDTSRDTVATSRPRAPPPTHPRTAGATANLTTHTMHTPPSPAGAFVDRKQVQATTSPEGKRMGLLARYSKYSHDRPWTGFGLVLFVVFLLTTVVGAANLAAFSTDDSDKVRARPLSEAYNAIVKTNLFFFIPKKEMQALSVCWTRRTRESCCFVYAAIRPVAPRTHVGRAGGLAHQVAFSHGPGTGRRHNDIAQISSRIFFRPEFVALFLAFVVSERFF